LTSEQKAEFNMIDKDGKAYRLLGLRQRGAASRREDRPDMYFPIYVNPVNQEISIDKMNGWEEVYPRKSDGSDGRWMWGKDKCRRDTSLLVTRLIERRNEFDIFVIDPLARSGEERTRKFKSVWDSKLYNNQAGTQEVKFLLKSNAMSFPKPVNLLSDICRMGLNENDTILDFFSGSATTAHAVMQLNAEDASTGSAQAGKRKFIMVQLPEICDEKSEAFKAGYLTIAEIGKERIRRAGNKIKQDYGNTNVETQNLASLPDIGFRVLKVDSSNMKDVYYTPDAVQQTHLFDQVDNIRADRTAEDLLFQVLLDWGVNLTLPITHETIAGKTVLFVDGNALAACFDEDINEAFVKELASRHPMRVVFRDDGFANDSVKINIEQIFKLISPSTEIKTL
jgi:adenine-specific DNA-methyltransferase